MGDVRNPTKDILPATGFRLNHSTPLDRATFWRHPYKNISLNSKAKQEVNMHQENGEKRGIKGKNQDHGA